MSTFKSLHILNYRIWFVGALISNVGTWMQRTAQDWLVFAHLTAHDAGAVGITMALQLGPQLFLAPVAGLVADRFNRKRLLVLTQSAMALLSAGLGILVVTGAAQLWHVYAFALMLGVVSALDAPVRQTFVSELVQDDYLPNAVALNSASFNVARMIGPAVAGVLTAVVGPGWVFLINTLTFVRPVAEPGENPVVVAAPAAAGTGGQGQDPGGAALCEVPSGFGRGAGGDLHRGNPGAEFRPVHRGHGGDRIRPGRGGLRPDEFDHGHRIRRRGPAVRRARQATAAGHLRGGRRLRRDLGHRSAWPRTTSGTASHLCPWGCSRSP